MLAKIFDKPIKVSCERAWRTYVGGSKIGELMEETNQSDTNFPELWILSTVRASNSDRKDIVEGLGKINIAGYEALTLAELIMKHPIEMLGKNHALATENKMGVLTKIIDSKERLTIQTHPTKENARRFFDSDYGKTEAWHILGTRDENACIYLGFKEEIKFEDFKESFYSQNLDDMLNMLHKIEVKEGETYLIPGGFPHAIGESCMLIEIQEPTDYTLRVEKTTPFGLTINDLDCHQGIGVDNMFECFDQQGYKLEEIIDKCQLSRPKLQVGSNFIEELVTYKDTNCFSLEKILIKEKMDFVSEDVFYGLFIYEGKGDLIVDKSNEKSTRQFRQGDAFFITPSCHEFQLKADLDKPIVVFKLKGQEIS